MNVSTAGNYKFTITGTSSQNSLLISVGFNGQSIQQAIDAGQSITVYFNGVTTGAKTPSIAANSANVAIGQISAATY